MTDEEKKLLQDSQCITDEQRKEWNKKIVEDSLSFKGCGKGYCGNCDFYDNCRFTTYVKGE